ncbi:MAG: RND transporter, partial [Proteobacteria bacterium]|nr:RND transporter [Pseudomonadota bacterium]
MNSTEIFRCAALGACILSTLAACAVGPDYKTPAMAVPGTWANADKATTAQAPKLADWWTSLNDPILTGLIEEAVQKNLDVANAKAKIREARATRREKFGALAPTLEATASATANRSASGTSVSTQGSSG